MYSLAEIVKHNNPNPKDYKEEVEKNIKRNSRVEKLCWETELQGKKDKVKIIDVSKLTHKEAQEELEKVFEGV